MFEYVEYNTDGEYLLPWDEFTSGTPTYSVSNTIVDPSIFLWWMFFSCSNVSRVKHFKEFFDWIWRDSLTSSYVINSDWFTYLSAFIFFQAQCLIILHFPLFLNYCFVAFCISVQMYVLSLQTIYIYNTIGSRFVFNCSFISTIILYKSSKKDVKLSLFSGIFFASYATKKFFQCRILDITGFMVFM